MNRRAVLLLSAAAALAASSTAVSAAPGGSANGLAHRNDHAATASSTDSGVAASTAAATTTAPSPSGGPSDSGLEHRNIPVCAAPAAGEAACDAILHDNGSKNGHGGGGGGGTNITPSGYSAADIESAYGLPPATTNPPSGALVAVVDAYDDPNAASDLAKYRSQMKLPACDSGCFSKVNQNGNTSPMPRANGGWAQEISLDLDMVSAACPNCRILLVEASSASFSNLAAAVTYATSVPGVVAISNSYGGSDSANISAYETAAARGIAVTASTGDNGYGVEAPASFSHVVAVGGTSLTKDSTSGRGWTESAWSGAGSGCSSVNESAWQDTSVTMCVMKANADVSAVADPNTGVAVYDSYSYQGRSGWLVFGGTSVASPIIASVYALADNFGSSAGTYTWEHSGSLNDVITGSNGSCATSVWCRAGTGWDGPTGLGTPNGTGAF